MSTSTAQTRKPRLDFKDRVAGLPKPVKIVLWALFAVFLFALPLLNIPFITTEDSDFGGVLFTVATYVLVALGLNIVVGYAGLLDLGYVGFYAIGAYVVGVLSSAHASLPWLVAVPIAIVVAMISGVILGAPTLRVRGDYLAIVTLGFGEIVRLTLVNSQWLGGARGITDIPRPPGIELFEVPSLDWSNGTPVVDLDNTTTFLKFGIGDFVPYYWLALVIIVLVLVFDILVKNSRVGRAWEATREDEDAAELMGVPTFRFKLLAFSLGAAIGGLSGALFAGKAGFISPDSFQLLLSILFIAAVVVGGAGNRVGVILGAIVVSYFPERFREFADFRVLVFGLALMVLAIFRPQGILPPGRTRRVKRADEREQVLEEGLPDA
ncbi:branched-chain amino acid ABC transporter permease [Humibacillus sp. DSM 29435]|uniref:branched-chain amino acid ABC transporter permease n=1 Tax=Humibacillus sp. DSM 29435 TaxID=1869167 RepID=UPI000873384A|nr:branched-chain amino acid ABC transporter permease [Humibacillus sp. DSM 29435]OFE17694.1 branched-chain amino acid ABC transporter permease [Humibacillus sp. DSM 29435]